MTPDFECGLVAGGGAVGLAFVLFAATVRWLRTRADKEDDL
ncbi:hypothetical protein [Acetobacter fabarum]|jgi:hypothetical protein|nr:hypothetical protein [Acetobacter fabarum]